MPSFASLFVFDCCHVDIWRTDVNGHLHAALYLLVSSILTWMSFTWSKSRSQPTLRPPEPCNQHQSFSLDIVETASHSPLVVLL